MERGYVRKTEDGDVYLLAPHVRDIDRRECMELARLDPIEALHQGRDLSTQCNTIIGRAGDVVGMFGCAPSHLPEAGYAWLLSSDVLYEHANAVQFIRQVPPWIDKMQADFPTLFNFISVQNVEAIRWLEHVGFRLIAMHDNLGGPGCAYYEIMRF